SESGFEGVSVRQIAERANVSHGLLTYHFKSKEMLWRAAADQLFGMAADWMEKAMSSCISEDPKDRQRQMIREMVYFNAEHPEMMRFMMEAGKEDDDRTRWLAETHIRPRYLMMTQIMRGISKADMPHAFYSLVSACGAIFCVPTECKFTTGINPQSKNAIKRHAEFLANLMVPNPD
ncbi:MAG: TetR family transcriptional regulator, partial [Pseudomonadota bacterium]